jgi:hypothetical protein
MYRNCQDYCIDFISQGIGVEAKSIASTTARSSLNESTTLPTSARSVSFKEPVIHETYDPPSSKSQPSTVINVAHHDSVLHKIGIYILIV